MWIESNYRFFHYGELNDMVFTGDIEITLKNPRTGETWECHGGAFTTAADDSDGKIKYTDVPI